MATACSRVVFEEFVRRLPEMAIILITAYSVRTRSVLRCSSTHLREAKAVLVRVVRITATIKTHFTTKILVAGYGRPLLYRRSACNSAYGTRIDLTNLQSFT